MKDLPKEGNLAPTAQEAVKLAILPLVLAFHGRKDDMEFRLVAGGGLAFAGLEQRTVLLITREALELLDRDELMAVAAHELGHDYFSDEYEEAQERGDHRRLQELELRCDGIAIITMDRLGVDIARLVSAAATLDRHNERVFGKTDRVRYVPLESTCPVHSCHGPAHRTSCHSRIPLKRRPVPPAPRGQSNSYRPRRA